jgi:homoserine kinase type II
MSVYTSIDPSELSGFLEHYRVGQLVEYSGIESGIENTNYFVTTTDGQYVLTLFEQHSADELPFFLDLTAFLAEHQIPAAHPEQNKGGKYLDELKSKPAALVARLNGQSVTRASKEQCAAVGDVLARMHVAAQHFPYTRANPRGPGWWATTAHALYRKISPDDTALLKDELNFQASYRNNKLPRGIVHADLFRDNILFDKNKLTGLIDFYYACTDVLLFDVAITVNDWCSNKDGGLDPLLLEMLLSAYQQVRPFDKEELVAWPVMLRAAALRFWLSRLHDLHFPRPGEMTHTKNPNAFRQILGNRREKSYAITPLDSRAKARL